jgi:hypothetical protein
MAVQIQLRNDTAANWTSANPTLAAGEFGLETDTDQFKVGDGTTAWTSLAYGGIQGPAGPTGADGPAGADGFDGADGANGDPGFPGTPGADAYEVAVNNGFVGTEAEWLESLVGADGADGASVSYEEDYSDVTTYAIGDIVRYVPAFAAVPDQPPPQDIAYIYISLQDANLNNTPDESPSYWALLVQDGANGGFDSAQTIESGTTRALSSADAGKLITNTGAITITVQGLFMGQQVDFVQTNAAQITFAAGAGMTLNSKGAKLKTAAQYSPASVKCLAPNTYVLLGDLGA